MSSKTKRIMRYILMVVTGIVLIDTLQVMGFGFDSGYFWLVFICYAVNSVMSTNEGIAINEDSIKEISGHSSIYLMKVYHNVQSNINFHKAKLRMLSTGTVEDDLDRFVLKSINEYGLRVSETILEFAEQKDDDS